MAEEGEGAGTKSELFGLLVTCSSMFLGAFLAGISCFKLDKRQLAWLNCFACGLLLGTALGVIIPEGVRSLYDEEEHHDHHHVHHEEGGMNKEGVLGWTLLLGFLTMMLLEDVFNAITNTTNGGNGFHHHGHLREDDEIGNTTALVSESPTTAAATVATSNNREGVNSIAFVRRRNTITLGLLIHNAMDGLAMGAAKASNHHGNMEAIVFGAIMMHHVPAAFGYATLLRSKGALEEAAVRKYMLVFSLAAPLSCALTYFALHPSLFLHLQVSPATVGICLLYSAGTFLYVAGVHALEEAKSGFPKWGLPQLFVLILGACVPGITSWGHKH